MYKKILAVFVLIGVFFVTGCGNEEVKTMNCSRKATVVKGVDMDLNYKVTYKGNYVTLVESEEKVISDDKDYLETYENTIKNMYSPYDGIEHYNYDIKVDGNTLTSTVKIDYENIDTAKLIEIDSANGKLIKDGKIKIDDMRSAYEAMQVTCEE